MGGFVAPHGEGLLDRFDDAVGPDGEHGQFAAVTQFLAQLHSLFYRIFIIFVHAEGEVGFVVPDPFGVRFKAGFKIRDLFDADKQFHLITSLLTI